MWKGLGLCAGPRVLAGWGAEALTLGDRHRLQLRGARAASRLLPAELSAGRSSGPPPPGGAQLGASGLRPSRASRLPLSLAGGSVGERPLWARVGARCRR